MAGTGTSPASTGRAVVAWAIGAARGYVLTYRWPTPVGATIPAFVITFVLYLLVSLRERSSTPAAPSTNLADATARGRAACVT